MNPKLMYCLLITSLFAISHSTAQNAPVRDTLTGAEFQKILRKEFNAVINSSGKISAGNYASADIKDGRLAFNATKNFNNGDMLSFNANGVVTDGFFAIFNNSKVNSNIGVNARYHFKLRSSSVSYTQTGTKQLSTAKALADQEFKIAQSTQKHTRELLLAKKALLEAELNIKDVPSGALHKAEIEHAVAIKRLQLDSVELKLLYLPDEADATRANAGKKKKTVNAAIDAFEYTGIKFSWISLGGGFQNNNFNQFNPKFSTLDSQVIKQNYVAWNAAIEYNLYQWNQYSQPTQYWLIGLTGTIDDNFSDLSKVELSDTRTYSDPTTLRTTTKKINAYRGTYTTGLLSARLYTDYYRFFFKNAAAIHLYPEVTFKEDAHPVYNAGIGLLYSFTDAKDKENKTKLNAELYYRLYDLGNDAASDLSLLRRNEIGLRLSIPVAFLNF